VSTWSQGEGCVVRPVALHYIDQYGGNISLR
jgi:hypothetical protein